jgi:hypothetical protein
MKMNEFKKERKVIENKSRRRLRSGNDGLDPWRSGGSRRMSSGELSAGELDLSRPGC